jgi:hypothetical protein
MISVSLQSWLMGAEGVALFVSWRAEAWRAPFDHQGVGFNPRNRVLGIFSYE